MTRVFIEVLYSDGSVVYTITLKEKLYFQTLKKNWDLGVRLKLLHTMLHTKHKVKQGLTAIVSLWLFTSNLHRENCVSRLKCIMTKTDGELGLIREHKSFVSIKKLSVHQTSSLVQSSDCRLPNMVESGHTWTWQVVSNHWTGLYAHWLCKLELLWSNFQPICSYTIPIVIG